MSGWFGPGGPCNCCDLSDPSISESEESESVESVFDPCNCDENSTIWFKLEVSDFPESYTQYTSGSEETPCPCMPEDDWPNLGEINGTYFVELERLGCPDTIAFRIPAGTYELFAEGKRRLRPRIGCTQFDWEDRADWKLQLNQPAHIGSPGPPANLFIAGTDPLSGTWGFSFQVRLFTCNSETIEDDIAVFGDTYEYAPTLTDQDCVIQAPAFVGKLKWSLVVGEAT